MRHVVLFFIRAYQAISPVLWSARIVPVVSGCRFSPSCSERLAQEIHSHGITRGIAAALPQLSSCHPWHNTKTS
ncbi:MAG: membrane protein insertion efficiency factor YidD [Candidatus Paceibacterota bacterium]|nr:MAG: membrane protein insertion efficiency factor YidD [Candidatus Paceibacterota bacterium]